MDPKYPAGAIVWVKLEGGRWWPGEVASDTDCSDVLENLRKPPLAVVKFFEEDCFHIVKSDQAIYPYDCAKKEEFLRRGKDFKMSGKDAFNLQLKFNSDVAKAEAICRPSRKCVVSKTTRLPTSPRSANLSYIKAPSAERFDYNTLSEERRPFSFCWGRYEELGTPRIRQQPATPKAKDSEYSCDTCGYKTARLENIVRHHKSHSDPYSFHPGKETEPMFVFEKAHPLKYKKKLHKDQSRHSTGSMHTHKSRSPQKKVDKGRIAFIPTPKKRKLPPDVSQSPKDSASAKKKSKASQVALSQVAVKKPFSNPFEEEEETEAPPLPPPSPPPPPMATEVPSEDKQEIKEPEEGSLDLSTDRSHEDLNDKDNIETEERKPLVISTVAWEEFIKDSPTKIHDGKVSKSVTRQLSESDSDNEPMPHEHKVETGSTNGLMVSEAVHAPVNFLPLSVAEPVHVSTSRPSLPVAEPVFVPGRQLSKSPTELAHGQGSRLSKHSSESEHGSVSHIAKPATESECDNFGIVAKETVETERIPQVAKHATDSCGRKRISLPSAESLHCSVNQVTVPDAESVHIPTSRVSFPSVEPLHIPISPAYLSPFESLSVPATQVSLPTEKPVSVSGKSTSLPVSEAISVCTSNVSLPVIDLVPVTVSKVSLPNVEAVPVSVSTVSLPAAVTSRFSSLHAAEPVSVCVSNITLPAVKPVQTSVSNSALPAAERDQISGKKISLSRSEAERVSVSSVSLPAALPIHISVSNVSLSAAEPARVSISNVSLPIVEPTHGSVSSISLPAVEPARVAGSKASWPTVEAVKVPGCKASLPTVEPTKASVTKASFQAVETVHSFVGKTLPAVEPVKTPSRPSNVSIPTSLSARESVSYVSVPAREPARIPVSSRSLQSGQPVRVPVSGISTQSTQPVRVSVTKASLPTAQHSHVSVSQVSSPTANPVRVPVSKVTLPSTEPVRVSISNVSLPAAEPSCVSVSQVALPATESVHVPVSRISFALANRQQVFKSRMSMAAHKPIYAPVSHTPVTTPAPLDVPVSEIPLPPCDPLPIPVSEIPLPPTDPVHIPVTVRTTLSQECALTHSSKSVPSETHKSKSIESPWSHNIMTSTRLQQEVLSVSTAKSSPLRSNTINPDYRQKQYLPAESQPLEHVDCDEVTELPIPSAQMSPQQVRSTRTYDSIGIRYQQVPSIEGHISQHDNSVEVVALDDMALHMHEIARTNLNEHNAHSHLTVGNDHASDDVIIENSDMVHGDIVVADGSLHAGDIMVGEEIEVQEIEIGEEVLQTEEIVLSDGVMHHVEIPLESEVHVGEATYMENNHDISASIDGPLNNSGLVLQCISTPYSCVDTSNRGNSGSHCMAKERGAQYLGSNKEAVNKCDTGDTISASEQFRLDECSIVNPAELSSSGSELIASGVQRKYDTVATTSSLDSRTSGTSTVRGSLLQQ